MKQLLDSFAINQMNVLFRVFLEFAPIFLNSLFWALIIRIFAHRIKQKFDIALVELIFFSAVGILIAYLVNLSKESVLAALLPSLVVVITFFFSLFARSRSQVGAPIGSREAYLAGFCGIVNFIIASKYFEFLN